MFDCFFLCWGWFQDTSVHVFLVDYFGLIILLGKRERFHVDNLLLFWWFVVPFIFIWCFILCSCLFIADALT